MHSRASMMEDFRAWLEERRAEWRARMGISLGATLNYAELQAFDAWLRARARRGELVSERVYAGSWRSRPRAES